MAVREARRGGHAVFGITIDRDSKSWFPRMFGQGGFALIPRPDRLTQALPEIYPPAGSCLRSSALRPGQGGIFV